MAGPENPDAPTAPGEKSHNPFSPTVKFILHSTANVAAFLFVLGMAWLLHLLSHALPSLKAPPHVVQTAVVGEWILLGFDIVLFLSLETCTSIGFAKSLFRQLRQS